MSEDKGATGADAAASRQADVGAEIGERARATFDHARDDARALADRARDAALSAFDRQKAEAASQLDGLAQAFRNAAESLDRQDYGPVARYAGLAAESLGGIAEALNDQDLSGLLDSARSLARRQPALFVGGAVALGFGLARFLKSSSEPGAPPPPGAVAEAADDPEDAADRDQAEQPARRAASRAKPRGRARPRATRARWVDPRASDRAERR